MSETHGIGETITLLSFAVTVCIVLLIHRILRVHPDSREPPFISSVIPYFSHPIQLFLYGSQYYSKLSARYRHDIYSLAMPRGRLYIVNSPDLVLSIERQPKIFSFWPIEARFTVTLTGMSDKAGQLFLRNLDVHDRSTKSTSSGDSSDNLMLKGMKAMQSAMMPGKGVNEMLRVIAQGTTVAMDKLQTSEGIKDIDFWKWLQHEVTMITTDSVYGPMNPYRQPEIEAAFWLVLNSHATSNTVDVHRDFSDDVSKLLLGFMPRLLARRGLAGREKFVRGFERYLVVNRQDLGSSLVNARFRSIEPYVGLNDIARSEIANGLALLGSTVATTFWAIYHVFSDAKLLTLVRDQAHAILTVSKYDDFNTWTIDLDRIAEAPALSAVVHETVRFRSSGLAARIVQEDVMLEDRYLLKKDSYLMIPSREMHFNPWSWGESAENFQPERFMTSKKASSGAFRGFGGGVNACPGKYFATMEIVMIIAMFVLRYDVIPKSGKWVDPQQDMRNMSVTTSPPQKKVIVEVAPREGFENGLWAFKLT